MKNLVIRTGQVYSKKNIIRRVLLITDIWVLYEILSEEPSNGIGKRIGYSVDGNPIYECSMRAFENWVEQEISLDVIQRSPDAVPVNTLGKILLGNDGVTRWFEPMPDMPLYRLLWKKEDGVWAQGGKGRLSKSWEGSQIIAGPPTGSEYEVIEDGEIVVRIVTPIIIQHEKIIN